MIHEYILIHVIIILVKLDNNKVIGIVVVLVSLIFFTAMLPEIVTQVQGVNTTSWSFTGYSGASTLFLLIPFILIAGYVIGIVADLL